MRACVCVYNLILVSLFIVNIITIIIIDVGMIVCCGGGSIYVLCICPCKCHIKM